MVSRDPPVHALQKWLAPLSWASFERQVLSRSAWAQPGVAMAEAQIFDWAELNRLLSAEPSPDVLVVAKGRWLPHDQPRSLSSLRALMARGIGICVRHSERQHPALSDLANSSSRLSGRRAHAQVFATPGGTYGFSWHYDAEHVFIIQTAGVKDYYFRKNTVDPRRAKGSVPDFSRIREERSPLQTARLIAGDCLYLPARWWHMAHCIEDSLSISLGLSEERSVPATICVAGNR